ncbi:MAG TPA: DsrE family protein [Polyangiales bacterium]|nr:DsrE family protein [Polyangiales bacterium]
MPRTVLTVVLNDAPYESARTSVAFRIADAALRRGYDLNVFAYEGAVGLAFARQTPHANAVHGRDAVNEDHPTTQAWIRELFELARERSAKLDWVNCGPCIDERGVADAVLGVRRGSPADLWSFVNASTNTLIIPTR